jgi:hypothetical protein
MIIKRKSPKRNSPKRKSPKRKSPKRKSPKRNSTKRKSPKRKSPKIKSPKRKSPKIKSPKRNSTKRNSPKRNSPKRNSPKRNSPKRNSPKRNSPKRNSTKRNSPKRNSPKRNSTKRNSTKRNSTKKKSSVGFIFREISISERFINLCNKYIIEGGGNLDEVIQTIHLKKNDCNIFLIGENHALHTKCEGIFEMLYKLTHDNINLEENNIKIDLMIEFTQKDVNTIILPYNDLQINVIRHYFSHCIKYKNCNHLHVHWVDPIISHESNPKHYMTIPLWLRKLNEFQTDQHTFNNNWEKDKDITDFFDPTKEDDIIKLLTENPIVMKEINQASQINSLFISQNIRFIFLERFSHLKNKFGEKLGLLYIIRSVMDFYTIARIIKLKMKNIIFYGGNAHSEFISYFFNKYDGFDLIYQTSGKCYNTEYDDFSIYKTINNKIEVR